MHPILTDRNTQLASLTLTPIGYISTPFKTKAEAPHQPEGNEEGIITLLEGHNFEQALEDVAGMEKIWLLYWFDRNPNWKPKVLVPRGERQKRGVFATRSPHRPNPIGLSLVDLIEVHGRTLRVRNVDLLDGTPILDIKPYLPYAESHPESFSGWIEGAVKPGEYSVSFSDLAFSQLEFLKQYHVDLRPRIEHVLSRDPRPHPYKRIEVQNGRLIQAIRGWRIVFRIEENIVNVEAVRSGYSENAIARGMELSDGEAQRAYHLKFGGNVL